MKPCKHAGGDVVVCSACKKNRDRVRKWSKTHKALHAARSARWNDKNRESRRKSWREYYHRKYEAQNHNRRLLNYSKRGAAIVDPFLSVTVVWEKDEGICHLCREEVAHPFDHIPPVGKRASIDHLVPLTDPSTPGHVDDNCRLAHRSCNSKRQRSKLKTPPSEKEVPF